MLSRIALTILAAGLSLATPSWAQVGSTIVAQGPAQAAGTDVTRHPGHRAAARNRNNPNPAARPGFAAPAPGETRFVADEVILSTRPNVSAQTLTAIAQRNRLTRMESQDAVLTGLRFYRWRIDSGATVAATVRSLTREPLIVSAQPNYIYRLQQDRAAEPPAEDDLQYALTSLRIRQAHALATGSHVLIALIDSEIDGSHPDLAGSIAARYETTEVQPPPHTHGTAMAGAIAAHHKLTGTAPAASLLAVRAFGGTEAGDDGTTFRIMQGLNWAAAHGARVINMSFAGPADPAVHNTLAAAHARGIVLVAASGNAGPKSPPLYPAAEPGVIAVTAVDASNRLFALATGGKNLAVAAPGVDVLVPAPDDGFAVTTGTSVATAEVSGIAALILERAPSLSPDAVRAILMRTAEHLGSKGRNAEFGAGLADAERAAEVAPNWSGSPATH